ncbi:hypothetical protein AALP_AA7G113800 [Arabis alpina]|uniref:Uncharacterized protein n=1 Tax=Arabis alpina TaxID=50452 RepID=A0A087GHD3_ARAAL|nr:hypothetical protein AALP_AA7G113800 [Arabis alpina]
MVIVSLNSTTISLKRKEETPETCSIMISVVIITELLVEYTTALAKITAGILPTRQGDRDVVRIAGFSLPCPPRSSPIPDFSSHLVDF